MKYFICRLSNNTRKKYIYVKVISLSSFLFHAAESVCVFGTCASVFFLNDLKPLTPLNSVCIYSYNVFSMEAKQIKIINKMVT